MVDPVFVCTACERECRIGAENVMTECRVFTAFTARTALMNSADVWTVKPLSRSKTNPYPVRASTS